MPTYEYACSSCGHRFDVRQSFSDTPIGDCPQCGATVRRVLYAAGVIFKGSGWYKTDSRQAPHSDATNSSSPESSSSSTGATSEGVTSDAKPESSKAPEPKKPETAKPAADD